jgi:hypothetical protein
MLRTSTMRGRALSRQPSSIRVLVPHGRESEAIWFYDRADEAVLV